MDYDMLCEGEIECPSCGQHLEFDIEDCESCDCGCEGCAEEKE